MSQNIKISVRHVYPYRQRRDMITGVTWVSFGVEIVGNAERIYGTLKVELPIEEVQSWANATLSEDVNSFLPYVGKEIAEWLGIGYTR